MLLDAYTPLKRIYKYKLKCNSYPWITLGLQKSVSVKKQTTYPILKEDFHTSYKFTLHPYIEK